MLNYSQEGEPPLHAFILAIRQARREAWEALATQELEEANGRTPSASEVESKVEEYERGQRAVDYDVSRDLRRAGAYTLDRLTVLPQHSTTPESLDAPAKGDDDEGPTIGEYQESRTRGADEVVSLNELARALARRIAQVQGRKDRRLYSERQGLAVESGKGRYHPSNPEEAAHWLGRSSRDTVSGAERRVEMALRGETLTDPDGLTPEGLGFSVNHVRRLHKRLSVAQQAKEVASDDLRREPSSRSRSTVEAAQVEAAGVERELAEIRSTILEHVDFRAFLVKQGVDGADAGRVRCVAEDESTGRTVLIDQNGFRCASCGAEGDIFVWLEALGFSGEEVDVLAARAAVALPPSIEREGKKVVVIQDPNRRHGLLNL